MPVRFPRRGDGLPRWLLVLTYEGRSLVWTSDGQPVDGLNKPVVGSVEVPDQIDRLELSGADVREPISVSVPWLENDQPRNVNGSAASISLIPASGYENRYVLVDGRVAVTELDRPNALIGIEIRPNDDFSKQWPPASYVVNDRTYPTTVTDPFASYPPFLQKLVPDIDITNGPDEMADGAGYPIPYGRHSTIVPAYAAPIVDRASVAANSKANTVLVGGGVLGSSSVYVWADVDGVLTESQTPPLTAVARLDSLGQTVNEVGVHNGATERDSKSWFASIDGIASPTVSAGAGHVALWLLSQVDGVDLVWSGEAAARTVSLELGGYLNEPVRPWDWFADRIAGRLPIATARAPSGRLRLVYVPFETATPTATLVDGESGVYRSGAVREFGERRYNAHVGAYSENWVTADGPVSNASPTITIEADDVVSTLTASVMARYAIWRNRYRREISLDMPTADFSWLTPGMVVSYTDADLSITAGRFLVLEVTRTDRPFMAVLLTPIGGD